MGILPFAYQHYGPLRLTSLGGYYFPFRGLPFARAHEASVARALSSALRSTHQLAVRIGPICRNQASTQALATALRADGWAVLVQPRGTEYAVELADSVERFRATNMSANLRSSIGRKHRRMQKEGNVRLERYSGLTPQAWQPVLRDMATIERSSWVGKSGGFLHFVDAGNAAFWSACLSGEYMSSASQACVLYFNDQPCAFEFWFDSGRSRYFIAGLHDDNVAQYSPGYYLMQLMLEDAIQRGLSHARLGQGDAGYKGRFGAKAADFIDDWIVVYPGLLARGAEALWKIRRTLDVLWQKRPRRAAERHQKAAAEDA
jgi:CelD/BcsL family acetyltransferase involved in cellulose biosynthesis